VVLVDGQQVAAREIEVALTTHPDVLECAVIATVIPGRGEVPVGLVVLRPGARVTEQDLKDHAARQLSVFKVRTGSEFWPAFPSREAGRS
jgi:acyl-coenzyme A synthetase/AMP-(fatty) acid ligase